MAFSSRFARRSCRFSRPTEWTCFSPATTTPTSGRYLIDGHYGTRDTFDPKRHLKDDGDGRSKPMVKRRGPHSGLIAVVTGTAGRPAACRSVQPPRPAGSRTPRWSSCPTVTRTAAASRRLGTFLLEIDGLTLTGTQVDEHGECIDQFKLNKVE